MDINQLLQQKPKDPNQFYRRPGETLQSIGVPKLQADPQYPNYFSHQNAPGYQGNTHQNFSKEMGYRNA